MLRDLKEIFPDEEFINTRLEAYTERMHEVLDKDSLRTVFGELRDGPSCDCSGNALASRMYLKLLNKKAENLLIHKAEPFMTAGMLLGNGYEAGYLAKAWDYMVKSHPHDSINGVTQDKTANDVEYRLEQAAEMGQVLMDHAAYGIISKLNFTDEYKGKAALVVFNPHPYAVEEMASPKKSARKSWSSGLRKIPCWKS